jgi:hypothetical protein
MQEVRRQGMGCESELRVIRSPTARRFDLPSRPVATGYVPSAQLHWMMARSFRSSSVSIITALWISAGDGQHALGRLIGPFPPLVEGVFCFGHWSLLSLRFPQCDVFLDGSGSGGASFAPLRSPCRAASSAKNAQPPRSPMIASNVAAERHFRVGIFRRSPTSWRGARFRRHSFSPVLQHWNLKG